MIKKRRLKANLFISWLIIFSFLLSSLSFAASADQVDEDMDICITYSSYNDLEMQYSLTDLTNEKKLQFVDSWGEIDSSTIPIEIDPSVTYQKWEGFGGSIDGATVYNYMQLNDLDKQQLIKDLFSKDEGNAYNMMRLSIACSDFTIDAPEANQYGNYPAGSGSGYWTYDDILDEDTDGDGIADSDFDLSNFSIQKDIDNGTIEFIKAAQKENPSIKFFASMWSAPAWMKKNESITWNDTQVDPEIKEGCYEVLAEYYCKFINSYKEQGIDIYAVTLQNEPDIKIGYPSALFTPENQIKFALCLKEAFDRHNIETKIWGMDANEFETWNYAVPLLESEAGNAVDGIAFHNYGGIEMLYPNSLMEEYPGKTFHITEMTVGGTKLVEYLRNNISTYAYWITYYDIDMQNHTYGPGPSFWSKPQSDDADHWSLSQLSDNEEGGYQKNAKYYTFGQFSRYIDVGAVRVYSSETNGNISNVAFQNPDGTMVLIVVNRSYSPNTNADPNTPEQSICIETPQGAFWDVIPGDTIATYTWNIATGDYLENDNWHVNANSEYPGYFAEQAIDDSADSLWFSGKTQQIGDEFIVDLGSSQRLTSISYFHADKFKSDFPYKYNVQFSEDGFVWEDIKHGNGSNGLTNIILDKVYDTRYIKLVLEEGKDNWWNISNIAVFCNENKPVIHEAPFYSIIEDKSEWTVQATSNRVTEDKANEIVDGDINTVWTYQYAQSKEMYIQIDMGTINEINDIEIDFGNSEDYARGYIIQLSKDGITWHDFGQQELFEPERDEYGNIKSGMSVVIGEEPFDARYIRIQITRDVSDHWLRIAEVSVNENNEIQYEDRSNWFSVSELFDYSDVSNAMFDGDIDTRWTSSRAQEPGHSVNMDFITPRTFNYIEMENGTDYPKAYKVYASFDGSSYYEIASGTGKEGLNIIILDDLVTAQCIRLELTDYRNDAWWSIYELNVGMYNANDNVVSKDAWTAYTNKDGVEIERYAIDDNLGTYWQSSESQISSGNYTTAYLLNMGDSQEICGISINSGSEMWSYLEEYEVYAWIDGEDAKLVAKGYGNKAITRIYFSSIQAKYVWIKSSTTSGADRRFAIAELNVYTKK